MDPKEKTSQTIIMANIIMTTTVQAIRIIQREKVLITKDFEKTQTTQRKKELTTQLEDTNKALKILTIDLPQTILADMT